MNTVDSTIDLGNPVFIAVNAVFLLTVLAAVGRWLWLILSAIFRRRLPREHAFELIALSLPLAALAFTVVYIVFTLAEFS